MQSPICTKSGGPTECGKILSRRRLAQSTDENSAIDLSDLVQKAGTSAGLNFTTVVPAMRSCHDWRSFVQPAQKNPTNNTAAEINAENARTSAVAKSGGWPSSRTTLVRRIIAPIVWPFQVHIPT